MSNFWPNSFGQRGKSNSIKDAIAFLEENPFCSESTICQQVWGFYRGSSRESNKKYAEMIRRGVKRGDLIRVQVRENYRKCKPGNTTYYYAVNKPGIEIPVWAKLCIVYNDWAPWPARISKI